MNGHEQRQIDELKDDVRSLGKHLSEFTAEARERGAEIVGLINTSNAEAQGDRSRLEAEVRANKVSCDDNHGRAMRRIDAVKANGRWWFVTAVGAGVAAVMALVGGWAENYFGK